MGDIRFLTACLIILIVGSVRLTCTEYRSALDQHEYRLDSPGSISFVPRLQGSLLGHSLATNSRAHHVGKSSNRLTLFYICTLLVSNAHDTETNPGPNIYPCGYCEQKVDWSDMAVQCDEYNVWYHISCYDIGNKPTALWENQMCHGSAGNVGHRIYPKYQQDTQTLTIALVHLHQ